MVERMNAIVLILFFMLGFGFGCAFMNDVCWRENRKALNKLMAESKNREREFREFLGK
jgi:hypothetical protein